MQTMYNGPMSVLAGSSGLYTLETAWHVQTVLSDFPTALFSMQYPRAPFWARFAFLGPCVPFWVRVAFVALRDLW